MVNLINACSANLSAGCRRGMYCGRTNKIPPQPDAGNKPKL